MVSGELKIFLSITDCLDESLLVKPTGVLVPREVSEARIRIELEVLVDIERIEVNIAADVPKIGFGVNSCSQEGAFV